MHRSKRQASAGLLASLSLASWAAPLAAESAPASSSAAAKPCSAIASSLGALACELGEQLLPRARGAAVQLISLQSDVTVVAPQALEARVRELVAGITAPQAEARSAEVVELRVTIERGVLAVTADLKKRVGLWQRARTRASVVLGHGYAERPLDAELRRWVPAPALVVSEVTKVELPERPVVALACGDIGRDGAQELLLVSRSSVAFGRIAGGRFTTLARAPWSELAAVAPAPLREPIATASIESDGAIRVGLSDRAEALELSAELRVLRRFGAALPAQGGGCSARLDLGFSGAFGPCTPAEPSARLDLGGPLDAAASTAPTAGDRVLAGRSAQRTLLLARLGTPVYDSGETVGAQLALGDADRDGAIEVASSLDTTEAKGDQVRVSTWRGRKLERRFELAATSGVSALSFCQSPEGPGMAPLLIATADELWVVR